MYVLKKHTKDGWVPCTKAEAIRYFKQLGLKEEDFHRASLFTSDKKIRISELIPEEERNHDES